VNSRLTPRSAKRRSVENEYELLTLDVFDTCLIREFISQESLWYLLGQKIVERFPGIPSTADFIRLRAETEEYVRGQSNKEDITLAEVYRRIALIAGWSAEQRLQAIALEEDMEISGLRANPAARDLLARAQKATVCYLTDTPHRGAFIGECLNGQSMPSGEVLSSGELGIRKGTGSLFREAEERFNVSNGKILHVGNDLRSDGVGSAHAGVAFAPFVDANPTRYEWALDGATRDSSGLLGAVLSGSGRDFRLDKDNVAQSSSALVSLVTGVAGPSIFAAAAWTLLSAQQDSVRILYFAARDGEILLAAAKSLQQELGMAAEIECRYLYGSRKAWHLPALSLVPTPDFAEALRRLLLLQSSKTTLRGLLSYLDLRLEEAEAVTAGIAAGSSADAPLGDQLSEVIDALVSSAEFQSLALSRAKEAYEATVGYLQQEEMFGGRRVGLVDIGWHGHASASLVAIAASQSTEVLCYFAGGLCGHSSKLAPKDGRAYLIDARGKEPKIRPALVHLLETFCAGGGGSTLGYVATQGRYFPRLSPDETNAAIRWGLQDYQSVVSSYVNAACRSLAKFKWKVTLDELIALRPYLIENLCALWDYPSYEEAELWGSFPFEGDSGTAMLGRPVSSRDLANFIRCLGSAEKRPRFGPWSRAVIVRTIGSRKFANPFGLLHAVSPSHRQMLLASVRSKLALRPMVDIEDFSL
jgi:FMN phosphatase YigB (HAD superfamily)